MLGDPGRSAHVAWLTYSISRAPPSMAASTMGAVIHAQKRAGSVPSGASPRCTHVSATAWSSPSTSEPGSAFCNHVLSIGNMQIGVSHSDERTAPGPRSTDASRGIVPSSSGGLICLNPKEHAPATFAKSDALASTKFAGLRLGASALDQRNCQPAIGSPSAACTISASAAHFDMAASPRSSNLAAAPASPSIHASKLAKSVTCARNASRRTRESSCWAESSSPSPRSSRVLLHARGKRRITSEIDSFSRVRCRRTNRDLTTSLRCSVTRQCLTRESLLYSQSPSGLS